MKIKIKLYSEIHPLPLYVIHIVLLYPPQCVSFDISGSLVFKIP